MVFLKKEYIQVLRIPSREGMQELPFVEIPGKIPGPGILITAGMDGDEYTGIEAAYRLAEQFKKKPPAYGITILPIVNFAGFRAGISENPLDWKFPKHIFPGNKKGTASEVLIATLWEKWGAVTDIWLDLHSGARNETLTPFVWGYETRNTAFNTRTKSLLRIIGDTRMLFAHWDKVERIAETGRIYLLFESGEKGEVATRDAIRHTAWVTKILRSLEKSTTESSQDVYRRVRYYLSEKDGIWEPHNQFRQHVPRLSLVGHLKTLIGQVISEIYTKEEGLFLWQRRHGWVKKGEVLLASGHDVEKI